MLVQHEPRRPKILFGSFVFESTINFGEERLGNLGCSACVIVSNDGRARAVGMIKRRANFILHAARLLKSMLVETIQSRKHTKRTLLWPHVPGTLDVEFAR